MCCAYWRLLFNTETKKPNRVVVVLFLDSCGSEQMFVLRPQSHHQKQMVTSFHAECRDRKRHPKVDHLVSFSHQQTGRADIKQLAALVGSLGNFPFQGLCPFTKLLDLMSEEC